MLSFLCNLKFFDSRILIFDAYYCNCGMTPPSDENRGLLHLSQKKNTKVIIPEDLLQLKLKINGIRKRIRDYWLLLEDPNGVSWSRNAKNRTQRWSPVPGIVYETILSAKTKDATRDDELFRLTFNQRVIILAFFFSHHQSIKKVSSGHLRRQIRPQATISPNHLLQLNTMMPVPVMSSPQGFKKKPQLMTEASVRRNS